MLYGTLAGYVPISHISEAGFTADDGTSLRVLSFDLLLVRVRFFFFFSQFVYFRLFLSPFYIFFFARDLLKVGADIL